MRPARLNAAIASLFIVGSACFVLGSVNFSISPIGLPYFAQIASLKANAVAKWRSTTMMATSLSGSA